MRQATKDLYFESFYVDLAEIGYPVLANKVVQSRNRYLDSADPLAALKSLSSLGSDLPTLGQCRSRRCIADVERRDTTYRPERFPHQNHLRVVVERCGELLGRNGSWLNCHNSGAQESKKPCLDSNVRAYVEAKRT